MADGGDGTVLMGPWSGKHDPIEDEIYAAPEATIIRIEPKPEPPKVEATPAWNILNDAANLIDGDRNVQHGDRKRCHTEISKLWEWWTGMPQDAHDVAIQMALLKIARIKTGSYNRDCYVDACGYLAIAGEIRNGKDGI